MQAHINSIIIYGFNDNNKLKLKNHIKNLFLDEDMSNKTRAAEIILRSIDEIKPAKIRKGIF